MRKTRLLGTSALGSAAIIGLSMLSAPALAQTGPACSTLPTQAERDRCVQAQAETPTQTETPAQTEAADPDTLAQTEVDLESGQPARGNEITVTGTRIRSPNLVSPIPITSIGAQELLDGGDVSLGDSLNDLPALRSTFSQANSTRFIGTSGLNFLDLRGLGTDRTLVLVNGRRHVTSNPGDFRVDTNTIPQALLERVDVITGGSSALYGSDAVAGVVNFILRRDFEGVRGRVQGGISERGDRASYLVSLVAGKNFFDDRLNVAVSGEFTRQEQVLNIQREEQTGAIFGAPGFVTVDSDIQCRLDANGVPIPGSIPNCDPAVIRGSDGIPDTEFRRRGTLFGFISQGGTVQTSCPAALPPTNAGFAVRERQRALVCTGQFSPTGGRLGRNFVFQDDGSLIADPITEDLRSVGGGRFGGLTSTGLEGGQLIPESQRYATNLLMNLELTRAFQPFLEAKYVRVTANQASNQPTFVANTLSPRVSIDNAFLTPQARELLRGITGNGTSFLSFRFNNDLGTRSEINKRETYRGVLGVRGDLNESGSLNYEIAGSYGRTDINRVSSGNILVANFNNATNAVLAPAGFTGTNFATNSQGQRVVCAINADANTANDDPRCVPINLFGRNNSTQAARDFILTNSTFQAKAEQINVVGFVSGNTESFFNLPGGAIGAVVGAEYRRETAFSDADDITQSGATFLNAAATFEPPALELYEAFAELRIPLLADRPFFNELTVTAAGRVSDYSSQDKLVYAYNAAVIYAPFRDLRFRAGYGRSVRAPDLGDLFGTRAETFANGLVDPCNQNVINNNPNRVARCAEAGIPTTVRLPDGTVVPFTNVAGSGVSGFNQGNPNLVPEVGISFTAGAVFQPRFIPGFSLSVDYYDIEVKKAISGLSGQAILNACFEDPVSIRNPFCAAIFRRPSTGDVFADFTFAGQSSRRFEGFPDVTLPRTGPGFLNQPFNFQSLRTRGIDFDAAYRRDLFGAKVNLRGIVSYLIDREFFTFISEPDRATNVVSVVGDPQWEGNFSATFDFSTPEAGGISLGYDLRWIDKQLITAFENNFAFQGREPTNVDALPVRFFPTTFYHDIRMTISTERNRFRFNFGVDNVFDKLPPFGQSGTGAGTAIFNNIGRYFYAGAEVRF